jgi:hypothetical protein
MIPVLRQQILSGYMLSAEPQVRSTLIGEDFLYSDRYGVLTFDPLVFKPVGDIQNKLLSENRTAMAAIEDNGKFTVWTGTFDKNGMPIGPKTIVFESFNSNYNSNSAPFRWGFERKQLGIMPLNGPKKNEFVKTNTAVPANVLSNQVKVKLLDDGTINLYVSDQLYYSSPIPGKPSIQPAEWPSNAYEFAYGETINTTGGGTTGGGTTGGGTTGGGTTEGNTTNPNNSIFSSPVVLAALAFAAFKFLK